MTEFDFFVEMQKYKVDDRPRKFVLQDHYRGKSVHLDFRREAEPGSSVLYSFTVAHMKPGIVKEDVFTMAGARKYSAVEASFKFTNEPSATRMFADEKKPQDRAWLTYTGVKKPGEVAATAEKFGVVIIRDSGTLSLGVQLPYFREWFLHGKKYTGRFICRLIQRRKPEKAKAAFVWQFGKPLDQAPYVLSLRAQQKGLIPPQNVSLLPPEIKKKIPAEFQYWKFREPKKRIEVRNALRKEVKKLNLTYEGVKLEEEAVPYGYQHHYWKKRELIRAGPSEEHFDLRIEESKTKPLIHFVLYDDILETEVSAGYTKPSKNHEWLHKDAYLPPGTEGNPTKDTPAWIKLITKGKVVILEKSRTFWKLNFLSGKLKGSWTVTWETPTANYVTIKKAEVP